MTTHLDRPVAVIGAGSSGLAAARAFRRCGFDVQVFEIEDEVGGNWNFDKPRARVYDTTHTVSSKPFTQYPDFPMPDGFPDYPHHTQILEYLKRYSAHFGLDELISFRSEITACERADGGGWRLTVRDLDEGRTRQELFRAVIVANGHNWSPKIPEIPGELDAEVIHSADYREASIFQGQRVLVVGAGNTGCDVVVEAARRGDAAFHSTRRGYWYAPKFVLGKPGDQIYDLLLSLRLPASVVQTCLETAVRLTLGHPTKAGLPEPDHRFLETHPVTNDLLVFYAKHGRITPCADISRFDGDRVVFDDGDSQKVDLVVFCTGYHIDIPFLDARYFRIHRARPETYLNVFSPKADDLFFIGFIQPDSGQFKLVHWQSVAAARYLRAQTTAPSRAAEFQRRIQRGVSERADGGIDYAESSRHFLEVQHMDYLRRLDEAISTLELY